VAPPSAAPYLVPVDVCFIGVLAFSNDRADAAELERPSVAGKIFGGLDERPSVGWSWPVFDGLRGTVRGNPVMVRPLLVDVPVKIGLTGRAWLVSCAWSSTVSSCSSASRSSSDSELDIVSRLLGLKVLLGLRIGDGDMVRPVLVTLGPIDGAGVGDIDRLSVEGDGLSFSFAGEAEGVEMESCRWGRLA
jgi:hypothetical protein